MSNDRYHLLYQGDDLQDHRYNLQERYLELTRVILPAIARQNKWRITEDHCFMRVVLDQLFGGCWYDFLDRRRTAYKQLNETRLKEAIRIAEQIESEGEPRMKEWNRQSLQWRGESKHAVSSPASIS